MNKQGTSILGEVFAAVAGCRKTRKWLRIKASTLDAYSFKTCVSSREMHPP